MPHTAGPQLSGRDTRLVLDSAVALALDRTRRRRCDRSTRSAGQRVPRQCLPWRRTLTSLFLCKPCMSYGVSSTTKSTPARIDQASFIRRLSTNHQYMRAPICAQAAAQGRGSSKTQGCPSPRGDRPRVTGPSAEGQRVVAIDWRAPSAHRQWCRVFGSILRSGKQDHERS